MSMFNAPANWRAVDFISDLHLSEQTPRSFAAWAEHLASTEADAVFMLGDLFEVWVGDDAREESGSFEQRGAQVLCEASGRHMLAFMAGNRDFLVGERMLKDCGIRGLPDPTVLCVFGQRILLSHGDALCLGDTEYQRFRAEVRSLAWQEAFLSRPLAERRHIAQAMRDASEQHKRTQAPAEWVDIDPAAAMQWMRDSGTTTLVHGHTHRPRSETLAPGFVRHVLSDWDLEEDARPPRAEVLRLSAAGWERRPPSARSNP